MQIDKIGIKNFKLFVENEFSFHPRFNLLVGMNGSGKTSLLRAIAVALGGWAHAYINNSENHRPISDDEIREIQIDQRFDKTKLTSITASGTATIIDRYLAEKKGSVNWSRSRRENETETKLSGNIEYEGYKKIYPVSFETLGNDALSFIETGGKFGLPLFAFYECDRLWLTKEAFNVEQVAQAQYSRFDAYLDCFHTGASHKQLGEWLLKNELASFQKKSETPVLQSIRAAARMALEGCTDLRFDFDEARVMVEFEGGQLKPFDHLSDGQRTMLGLFCDLARRAAILNPHYAGEASLKTEGVVLVDELDLHLHPRWQRKIISGLRALFPNIQFICTTHSPFLIQSLGDGRLISLSQNGSLGILSEYHNNDGRLISLRQNGTDTVPTTANQSIEDIIELIQGVEMPQRSQRYLDMMQAAEKYFTLLQQALPADETELSKLKQALDSLSTPFSDDPAYQAFLNVERLAALGDKNP